MRKFKNPIITHKESEYGRTADPYVLRYNGIYYHCYMKRDGVYLTEADKLWNIGTGREMRIFADTEYAMEWYAPELHRIDNKWYIYGAPSLDGEEAHSMCVLEYDGETPMGSYEFKGKMRGIEGEWSIDGTVFEHDGIKLFVWTDCGQIYIAEMESPYSLKGEAKILAKCAELEFEQRCGRIIEGPAVLKRGDKIHIVYSANNSKSDEYCLGILSWCGGDIFDSSNWIKCEEAVFEKTDDIFGPGHCSFTTVTEDGEESDYIVYHANLESGSGWDGRCVWIQKFSWDENDMPVFGKPQWKYLGNENTL